ncbi:hypothetical protein CV093_18745 [Oceanobacillus sp. 143]|nr:hypothetical protein CV093_18745 [Oceanobacillus sp. 143]
MEKIKNQSYQQVRIIVLISVFDGYEEIYNQYNHNNVYVYLEEYVYENIVFQIWLNEVCIRIES